MYPQFFFLLQKFDFRVHDLAGKILFGKLAS